MSEMKDEVYIYFDNKYILIGGKSFFDDFSLSLILDKLPQDINFDGVTNMGWSDDMGLPQKGFINLPNGNSFNFGEDKYNDYIQPYVDIWQAEKDRIEQEQQAAQDEYNKFENCQARVLAQLNEMFDRAADSAYVKSSLGFTADANSTANENVNGLLITIGDGTVQFCDYNNEFHELNKSDLETLRSEIIENGQSLYGQKWQYRTALEQATTNDQLSQIIDSVTFTYSDFSK